MSRNMPDPIISVAGLSKKYILQHRGSYGTLRDSITEVIAKPFTHKAHPPHEEFWALRDVSFSVQPGERLGIIGRNGAGKSTLLKILSQITSPTAGSARLHGRVASLLEVGTGFHPELSGRENIFLNGAILGMSRNMIREKFDEIVEFAGVERFLDTPVKRYSSGMYVRLAFAVAAHLDSEILIVDEVLSVGDAQFQKKSLGKMQDIAQAGRTIIFVSHNLTAVKSFCTTALLLDNGQVQAAGDTNLVVTRYIGGDAETNRSVRWARPELAPGNADIRLRHVEIRTDNPTNETLSINDPILIETSFWNFKPRPELHVNVQLLSEDGVCIFISPSPAKKFEAGIINAQCRIPGQFLNSENYRLHLAVIQNHSSVLFAHEVLRFPVEDAERRGGYMGKWEGLVRPQLNWQINQTYE